MVEQYKMAVSDDLDGSEEKQIFYVNLTKEERKEGGKMDFSRSSKQDDDGDRR